MNGFLLDTNVPSELVRPQPEPKVNAWLAAQDLESLFVSMVSFGEWRKGIELRDPGKRTTELECWLETDLTSLSRLRDDHQKTEARQGQATVTGPMWRAR